MRHLIFSALLLATTLAHGQSTEIGARSGPGYNFSFFSGSPQENYYAARSGVYLHLSGRARWSYEISADHYQYSLSRTYNRTWYDVPFEYSHQTEEDHLTNSYFDVGVSILYDLHKQLPFVKRKFNNYIGLTAGLLLNTGQNNIKYSYADTNMVRYDTYGAANPIKPTIALRYYTTYVVSDHLLLNALFAFKISSALIERDPSYSFSTIYAQPNSFLLLQLGIGYKF